MINQDLNASIEEASSIIGKTWPLYGFVTSNPLSGYENLSFEKAIQQVKKYLGVSALPSALMFRQALEHHEIDQNILHEMLLMSGHKQKPDFYLDKMELNKPIITKNTNHELDRIVAKWLGAFMDEGMAEWEMPGRSKGFYEAWRKLAIYDQELHFKAVTDLPETANEVLEAFIKKHSNQSIVNIFKKHIAALPGWTGYIKYRTEEDSPWEHKCPITMKDYLAVRLLIANQLKYEISFNHEEEKESPTEQIQLIFLKAWELSWQNKLVSIINENLFMTPKITQLETRPDAQLVFCIDTRSELIRRHIEAKGNYETFGFAGFFGIATNYKNLITGLVRKSCPPILSSAYTISETEIDKEANSLKNFKHKKDYQKFAQFLSHRMKNMLPSAFGYVEGAGIFYGFSLIWKTLFPAYNNHKDKMEHERMCKPELHSNDLSNKSENISLEEKVSIVKSVIEILGIKIFAPLVVIAGHGSHSTNNPFASSLDCGACAASPGRHNARMLASLANLTDVRASLKRNFSIFIPSDTIFIGAEHNTTKDMITLFDVEIPKSHHNQIEKLKSDLLNIQHSSISERIGLKHNGLSVAQKKAGNWAETRPEWGLAGNASFIIAPRAITKDVNLMSRCFLQSYNWEVDVNGLMLEAIMQGPMVVGQWINNHYYFSTVNNDTFGGGSKITLNVTGRFGVVQGNGGDLKYGLPLQSVNSSDQDIFHKPLRLSVIIQAPLSRVKEILLRNDHLQSLIDKEWIYLMVMDPTLENEIKLYKNDFTWNIIKKDQLEEAQFIN